MTDADRIAELEALLSEADEDAAMRSEMIVAHNATIAELEALLREARRSMESCSGPCGDWIIRRIKEALRD